MNSKQMMAQMQIAGSRNHIPRWSLQNGALKMTNGKGDKMRNFLVQAQVNANNDVVNVKVQASNHTEASIKAEKIIRDLIGKDEKVKGCIVVSIDALEP